MLAEINQQHEKKEVALVGQSGWADGKFGNYNGSEVMLNDYVLINEFIGLNKNQRLKKLCDEKNNAI